MWYDADFNSLIMRLAPRHSVADIAPDTFESLTRHIGVPVVWSGASERTIYADPRVNHAFRAWHDALHLRLGAGFDLEGESRVALEQARIVCQYSHTWARLVMAEVQDQAEYSIKNGLFVSDQVKFSLSRAGIREE